MSKDSVDRLIDERISVLRLYQRLGVYISETRNFSCPHHLDDKPSAKLFEDHLFCFAERRNYYASDILKDLSPVMYQQIRLKVIARSTGGQVQKAPDLKEVDFSSLDRFKKGEAPFDVVLDLILKGEQEV